MIKNHIKLLGFAILSIASLQSVAQGDAKDQANKIIDQVVNAYGGETLKNLTHLSYNYEWQLAWPGQGYDISRTNFVTDKNRQQFNFKDRSASTERWISQNGNVYHNRYVSKDKETFVVDYFTQQYSLDENQSFDSQFLILSLYTDLYLAYAMASTPEKFTSAGLGHVEGRPSQVLMYQYREKAKAMKVHIDKDSGFILDTERVLNSGANTRIIFERHQQKDGLLFAKESRVFRDGQLIYYAVDNSISTEAFSNEVFELEGGLTKQNDLIDDSEMKTQKVGKQTYHVGSDGAFSTFYKSNEHLVGVNTYGGLNDRIAELRKVEKAPLKYMVITHHHSDHLAGINDAIDAGVTLIMTEMTQQYLADSPDYNLDGVEVMVVKDKLELGDILIFMVNTNHAAENLIVYHKKNKTLFQDDHYNAATKGKHTHINQSGLVLSQRLSDLNLDIDWILGGHAPKAESWKDFQNAVKANFIGNVCVNRSPICVDEKF